MVKAGRVAIVPKGEFEFGTQYTRLDMVTYEGKAYVAKKNNVSVLPTDEEHWMLLVTSSVSSVNGQTGEVKLAAKDIGAVAVEGDIAENITTYTSDDNSNPSAWTNVELLKSKEKESSFKQKVSQMFKNLRYICKFMGTTDISKIGDGTVTGALDSLNGNLGIFNNRFYKNNINSLEALVEQISKNNNYEIGIYGVNSATTGILSNGANGSGTVICKMLKSSSRIDYLVFSTPSVGAFIGSIALPENTITVKKIAFT